MLKFINCWL